MLGRIDAENPWLYNRCKEVYDRPDNCIDLWARGHYKSTIITYAKTLQDILCAYGDGSSAPRSRTFGIFSHTRPIASAFCALLRREFEANERLRLLFPDICWQNPRKEAPVWSNQAFTVNGGENRNEATVEAWGLVESQPTSKHFDVRIYDDVVTQEVVATPEQIKKATAAWELSINLGSTNGVARYIGTRYHVFDTYRAIMDRKSAHPRIYPATHDGTMTGTPVLWSQAMFLRKVGEMGPTTAACQLLQNPRAVDNMGFDRADLRFYTERPDPQKEGWNVYIIVDPANTKRKKSDWTAIGVIAYGIDNNYYVLELIRDRLSLSERAKQVMALHRQYQPLSVGYEEYGMQADIEHIKTVQETQQYRFDITPLGGSVLTKRQRIERLVPLFEKHQIWLPRQQMRKLYDGQRVDVINAFINDEYATWPVSGHNDDCLDMLARITDPDLNMLSPGDAWNIQSIQNYDKGNYEWIH